MKPNRIIGGLIFGLLLAASLVAAYLQPEPEAVARAACAERGVGGAGLALAGFRRSGWLVAGRETVEFHVQGANPPKKIAVELHQIAYFLPWQVAEVRDDN